MLLTRENEREILPGLWNVKTDQFLPSLRMFSGCFWFLTYYINWNAFSCGWWSRDENYFRNFNLWLKTLDLLLNIGNKSFWVMKAKGMNERELKGIYKWLIPFKNLHAWCLFLPATRIYCLGGACQGRDGMNSYEHPTPLVLNYGEYKTTTSLTEEKTQNYKR